MAAGRGAQRRRGGPAEVRSYVVAEMLRWLGGDENGPVSPGFPNRRCTVRLSLYSCLSICVLTAPVAEFSVLGSWCPEHARMCNINERVVPHRVRVTSEGLY